VVINSAIPEDLELVGELIAKCIAEMHERGLYQWSEDYPGLEVFEDDINNGNLYLLRDSGALIGVFTLDRNQDDEYRKIEWEGDEERAVVVHRLAIDPARQRQGLASKMMTDAEGWAVENGYRSIRLDVFSLNTRGIGLYESLGYHRRGEVHFATHKEPFYCYEKILQ
jgi:ribosomal protein S18 acetylase RimI-like enzyme